MKPSERLSRTLAQQAKKDASPEELRELHDLFPDMGEDEARSILEYREGEAPQEEIVQAVASTVADLAAVVDMDPRQLMDAAMGMLTEAVEDSAAQQALSGGRPIGALEQQAEDWAGSLEADADDWAAELDPDPEPLDPEDYKGENRIATKRHFGTNPEV